MRTSDPPADTAPFANSEERLPLHLGGNEDFERAALFFKMSHFDEPTVCGRLGFSRISEFDPSQPVRSDPASAEPSVLDILIRLFLYSGSSPHDGVERCIEPQALDALRSLDLLRLNPIASAGEKGSAVYYSPVLLSPVEGMLLASDRFSNPDGSPFQPQADCVFPPIYPGTIDFLRFLPKKSAPDVLDLCSGTGIGALFFGRYCDRVVASDITRRSTHFTCFNRLLNNRPNVEIVQGDLYSAVAGRTFDRIVAHPPYMPTMWETIIFRDGGPMGDSLLRRIVDGLPAHLRPGGEFYCHSMGLDTSEGPFEERVYSWLGAARNQFEAIFALSDERTPSAFAAEHAPPAEAKKLEEALKAQGVQRMVYGALGLRRRADTTPVPSNQGICPSTRRVWATDSSDGTCFERVFAWRRWLESRDALAAIAQLKPRLSPHMRLKTVHTVKDGALVPTELLLETEHPFRSTMRVDPLIVELIASFDGAITPADWLARTRGMSAESESISPSWILEIIARLVERGYLGVEI